MSNTNTSPTPRTFPPPVSPSIPRVAESAAERLYRTTAVPYALRDGRITRSAIAAGITQDNIRAAEELSGAEVPWVRAPAQKCLGRIEPLTAALAARAGSAATPVVAAQREHQAYIEIVILRDQHTHTTSRPVPASPSTPAAPSEPGAHYQGAGIQDTFEAVAHKPDPDTGGREPGIGTRGAGIAPGVQSAGQGAAL